MTIPAKNNYYVKSNNTYSKSESKSLEDLTWQEITFNEYIVQ